MSVQLIDTHRCGNLIDLFILNFTLAPTVTFLFFLLSSPPPSASQPAGPPPQISPDEAEQQAVHLLACSADKLPAPLPPINMFDLMEALQVGENYLGIC